MKKLISVLFNKENDNQSQTLEVSSEAEPTQAPEITSTSDGGNRGEQYASVQTGDIIQFGGYDWRILEVQDCKALLLSENIIEYKAYHEIFEEITWEQSSLRRYLNDEFYNSFSSSDRERIADTTVINSNNPWTFLEYGFPNNTLGGNNTTDKIFLLSIDDVIRYFGDSGMITRGMDENARTAPYNDYPNHDIYHEGAIHDQYSEARIACDFSGTASRWWLRTPGGNMRGAAYISKIGSVIIIGNSVISGVGVRPALWLNL